MNCVGRAVPAHHTPADPRPRVNEQTTAWTMCEELKTGHLPSLTFRLAARINTVDFGRLSIVICTMAKQYHIKILVHY